MSDPSNPLVGASDYRNVVLGVVATFVAAAIVVSVKTVRKRLVRVIAVFRRSGQPKSARHFGMEFGDLYIHDYSLIDGYSTTGIEIRVDVQDGVVSLPEDLDTLKRQLISLNAANEAEKRKPTYHDGENYGLVRFSIGRKADYYETKSYRLLVQKTSYFNFLASLMALDRQLPDSTLLVRRKYYANIDPTTVRESYLFAIFGVNITVITSDNMMVVALRSDKVAAGRGEYSSAVDEGFRPGIDVADGRPDYHALLRRAIVQEIGVEAEEYETPPMLTAIGYSSYYAQYSVSGHVHIKMTFATLLERFKAAPDGRFEADDLLSIPFSANGLADFLLSLEPSKRFITFGLASCIMTLLACERASMRQLNEAFRGKAFRDPRFLSPGPVFKPRIDPFPDQ